MGQEKATNRLKKQFGIVRDAYAQHVSDLQEQWNGNVLDYRFTTLGATIRGTVTVEPSEVTVNADLPLMAVMFKGQIEQQIRNRLTELLV